jgi:hypothetical protein
MDIATTPSEQEGGGDAIADLRNQVALNQEAISIMTIGEDDELISELQDEIDFLESMISDLGGGTSDEEVLEAQVEDLAEETDLELGEMKVGNDQEILPTPSADDPVVEEITDMEVEAIEGDDYDFEVELADEPSMEADDDVEAELEIDEDDDIEVNSEPTFEDEDEDFDIEGDIDLGDIDLDFAKGGEVDLHSGGYDVDKIYKIIRVDSSDSELGFSYVEDFLELGAFEWDKDKINRYFDELIQEVKQFDYGEGEEAKKEKEAEIRELEEERKGALALDFEDDFFLDDKIGLGRDDDALDFVNRFFKINEKRLVEVAPQVFKKYDDMFAKGGKTQSISEQVKDMTDEEVARKLTDLMYESLESFEYDMTEGEAYEYALSNIQDARNYLIDMMTGMEA